MAFERQYEAQGPFAFTANGGIDGIITLETVGCLKVKQQIKLSSIGQPNLVVQIKRVLSPTTILVGPTDNNFKTKTDVSNYTVADGATVFFAGESKPKLKVDDIWQAVYEQEPTVALRIFSVDKIGRPWDVDNPFPVQLSDGSVNIGTVNAEVEVQLSHKSNSPDPGDIADTVNTVDGFLDKIVDRSNNIVYEGVATAGTATSAAGWRITRTIEQPDGSKVSSVVGDLTYDQVWDDRASLFPAQPETDFFGRRFERLLPLLANANWMKLGDFDRITPSFSGDVATLAYFQNDAQIGKADIRYVHDLDWEINLERYVNDSDGDILLDDDDSPLNLD